MQGAHRLEIVVKGKRRTALDTTPEMAGMGPLENGFLMEEHVCRSLEMPDHWIPNYLVALHFVEKPVKRFLFASGKMQECVVRNGSCDVVAPHEVRRFRAEGESQSLILSIEPEALQTVITDSRPRNSLELLRHWHGEDPALRSVILNLSSEIEAGAPNGPLFVDALCTRLVEELVGRYSIGQTRLDPYKGGLSGRRLRQVTDYIECYLGRSLSTAEIARIAGLSKYHCGKAFKETTGLPLHSYVMARRISRARELLLSDLPLSQVAQAVGFYSQSHFTTIFLRCTGITPGSYRRMHKPLSMNIAMSYFA